MHPVTEERPEKYGKRLIGRTDMEDALKRLDNLTHEEARMAIAENLRATHAVDERVKEVSEQVLAVDDRVASVGDRLANVDDRVANVNDKVTEVIHGVCKSSSVLRKLKRLI
jgi:tetrahydromethanopterin S-methyltransferase subunit G